MGQVLTRVWADAEPSYHRREAIPQSECEQGTQDLWQRRLQLVSICANTTPSLLLVWTSSFS